MQANPYMIIKHVGRNISHVDGFVHQIVIWMAENATSFMFITSYS